MQVSNSIEEVLSVDLVVIQEPVKVEYVCNHCGCAVSINYKEFKQRHQFVDALGGIEGHEVVKCDCCGETNTITDIIWD